MSTGLLDLRAIKPAEKNRIHELSCLGFQLLPETVKCAKCNHRYLTMADFAGVDPALVNIFERDDALRILTERVSLEHETGHPAAELAFACEMHQHAHSK